MPGDDNKSILILFSKVPTTPAYRVMLEGIRTKLNEGFGNNYSLHTEYLETDRYPNSIYPKGEFDKYNKKYREVNLDLLICIGTDIISILKNQAESYLLDLPVVSIDYDFSEYGVRWDNSLNDKTTVITLKHDIRKIISAISQLYPEADSIYFISGTSNLDKLMYNASMMEVAKIKERKKAQFITDVSMDDVLKKVRHLPGNSAIILTSFSCDINRVPYYNPESVRLISSNANAPVFTYSSMGFGDGAVGGYLLNFDKVGQTAGDAVIKILNGTNPSSLKYSAEDYNEYMFDQRELIRWNLNNPARIPHGSKIVYREITFFGKYWWFIGGSLLFILLQTILILNLFRLNRNQKLLTRQIRESENKYRELVREDRILRIGQLTASLSHELNQPLTAILSTAQAGIRFLDSNNYTPELLKEILQNIVEDDKRTASILNSIRGMIKHENREKEKADINSLVNEVVAIYQSEAIIKNIILVLYLPDHPIYVHCNPIQIQQVILNLIVNAAQSIEKSDPAIRKIIINGRANSDKITISVRDFGEGIPDSLLDKLFKPFVTSKKDGVGIGLAISHTIIENHNGTIWAENMPDSGAEFSFELKIIKNDN